jgi:hypothetical protein
MGRLIQGRFTFKIFWRRLQGTEVRRRPVQADQPKEAFDKPRRLPRGHGDQHFIVRQIWMAASL